MNQVGGIFDQILELFPRWEFRYAVELHRGERPARGFTCGGQLVARLFCQLAQTQSLGEIRGGLASTGGQAAPRGAGECAQALDAGLRQRALPRAAKAEVLNSYL